MIKTLKFLPFAGGGNCGVAPGKEAEPEGPEVAEAAGAVLDVS